MTLSVWEIWVLEFLGPLSWDTRGGGANGPPPHMGQYLKKPTYDRVKLCTHSKIHLDPIFLDTFTFLGQKCNFLFIYSSKTEYLHWKQLCLWTLVDKMVYIIKLFGYKQIVNMYYNSWNAKDRSKIIDLSKHNSVWIFPPNRAKDGALSKRYQPRI